MSTATKIMVIRHAEKPADTPPPQGVDINGNADPESLIPLGWQRAGALACLFAPARGPLQAPELATPQAVFAAGVGHHSHSERPEETVSAMAAKLGLTTDTSYLKGDEEAMTTAAMDSEGVVLICWQHEAIPGIANQIVGNGTTVPQTWPGDRFDLVWVFDLDAASGTYSFTQVPQLLLAGDSAEPIT
ncbi:MAG TPA: hypothetical protein VFS20_10010 [Longimicrobium sp.]|nr:hypothetical protein [Longimicrobium sp.]